MLSDIVCRGTSKDYIQSNILNLTQSSFRQVVSLFRLVSLGTPVSSTNKTDRHHTTVDSIVANIRLMTPLARRQ
jgi:hypothetical protein